MRTQALSLIVAMDEDRGIGRDGDMPWHLPEDLARFRRATLGHCVIVGRTTLESLPGPLKGRRLISVGSRPTGGLHGSEHATSLQAALALAAPDRAFVAGGVRLYAESLPHACEILVTRIPGRHGCDRHFPAFGPGWRLASREAGGAGLWFEAWHRE